MKETACCANSPAVAAASLDMMCSCRGSPWSVERTVPCVSAVNTCTFTCAAAHALEGRGEGAGRSTSGTFFTKAWMAAATPGKRLPAEEGFSVPRLKHKAVVFGPL